MPNDPNAALFGGSTIEVTLEGGRKEEVFVRELKVREWPDATKYLESENDEGLMELVCNKPEDWAKSLSPHSFIAVVEEVKETNRDFFSYIGAKLQKRIDRVTQMPPEILKSLIESQNPKPLVNSLPRSRQRPA
jgi:hypothetical protein